MKTNALRKQGIGMIVVLALQYILGMTATIFVQFPASKNPGVLWEFAWKQLPVALHIIVGILMVVGSIVLVIRSIIAKSKLWIIVASISALMIIIAFLSGARFIGTQQNAYSFSMAIAFLIALLSYFWGIYKTKSEKSELLRSPR